MCGIVHFVTIGDFAFLAGMTRLARDVPPYMIVEGHEGRVRGVNTVGLTRGGVPEEDQEALKRAYRRLFRSAKPQSAALEEMRGEEHESTYVANLVKAMTDMEGAVRGRTREARRDGFMELGRERMRSMGAPGVRLSPRAAQESTPSSGSGGARPGRGPRRAASGGPRSRPGAEGLGRHREPLEPEDEVDLDLGDEEIIGVPQASRRARLADRSPAAAGRRRRGDGSVRGGGPGLHRGPRRLAATRHASFAHRGVRSPRPSRGDRGLYLPADFAPVLLLPSEIDPLEHEPLGSAPRLAEGPPARP